MNHLNNIITIPENNKNKLFSLNHQRLLSLYEEASAREQYKINLSKINNTHNKNSVSDKNNNIRRSWSLPRRNNCNEQTSLIQTNSKSSYYRHHHDQNSYSSSSFKKQLLLINSNKYLNDYSASPLRKAFTAQNIGKKYGEESQEDTPKKLGFSTSRKSNCIMGKTIVEEPEETDEEGQDDQLFEPVILSKCHVFFVNKNIHEFVHPSFPTESVETLLNDKENNWFGHQEKIGVNIDSIQNKLLSIYHPSMKKVHSNDKSIHDNDNNNNTNSKNIIKNSHPLSQDDETPENSSIDLLKHLLEDVKKNHSTTNPKTNFSQSQQKRSRATSQTLSILNQTLPPTFNVIKEEILNVTATVGKIRSRKCSAQVISQELELEIINPFTK